MLAHLNADHEKFVMQCHAHPETPVECNADGFLLPSPGDFDLCWDRAETLFVFHGPGADYAIDHWRYDDACAALIAVMDDGRELALPARIGPAIRNGLSLVRHVSIARTIKRKIVNSCTRPLRAHRYDA